MSEIKFSKEEKQHLVQKLQEYLGRELDIELGQFDTEFLLEFISSTVGPYFYNRGLYDAQAVMQSRVDDVMESISEIEKSV